MHFNPEVPDDATNVRVSVDLKQLSGEENFSFSLPVPFFPEDNKVNRSEYLGAAVVMLETFVETVTGKYRDQRWEAKYTVDWDQPSSVSETVTIRDTLKR